MLFKPTPAAQTSLAIIVGSIIAGFTFDSLFYLKPLGISLVVFTIVLQVVLGICAYLYKVVPSRATILWCVSALVFGAWVGIRSSDLLAVMNVCCWLASLIFAVGSGADSFLGEGHALRRLPQVVALPFQMVQRGWWQLNELPKAHKDLEKAKSQEVIRGLLIALPLVIIFLWLFADADPVFSKLISWFLPTIDLGEWNIFRVIGVFTAVLVIAGAIGGCLRRAKLSLKNIDLFELGASEKSIVLWAVNAVFIAFLLVQASTLFGNHELAVRLNITYAEYARQGFFQLIAVAVIALAVLLSLNTHTSERIHPNLRWLTMAFALQVLVVTASAFQRLMLYEQGYGFTTIRIVSHAATLGLGIIFISTAYIVYKQYSLAKLTPIIVGTTLALTFALNAVNLEGLVVRLNMRHFAQTNRLDTSQFYNISEDAVPVVAELLDHPDQALARRVAGTLTYRVLYPEKNADWQGYTVAHSTSEEVLARRAEQIKVLAELGTEYDTRFDGLRDY